MRVATTTSFAALLFAVLVSADSAALACPACADPPGEAKASGERSSIQLETSCPDPVACGRHLASVLAAERGALTANADAKTGRVTIELVVDAALRRRILEAARRAGREHRPAFDVRVLPEDDVATATFDVRDMTCASCGFAIRTAVRKLDGVDTVKVSQVQARATVTFDPKRVTARKIEATIDALGYEANAAPTSPGNGDTTKREGS